MTRKIVFIAGANHSGSTLLGCVLGAAAHPLEYFHIGEAHAFFNPGAQRCFANLRDVQALTPEYRRPWEAVDPGRGYASAYAQLFAQSGASVIIDSSKLPDSLRLQARGCREMNYTLQVVTSYRPFQNIYRSDEKRGLKDKASLKNIGRCGELLDVAEENGLALSVIDVDRFIAAPVEATRALCAWTGIPYLPGKEAYWRFPYCHPFGASTQRRHFRNPESAGYTRSDKIDIPELGTLLVDSELTRLERRLAELVIN